MIKGLNIDIISSFRTLILCFAGMGLASCETIENDNLTASSTVGADTAMVTARTVRWGVAGGSLRKGQGSSMAPIYGDNTVVVITPIDFNELEIGMVVAYRNKWGDQIVHQLVKRDGKRWVARGLNNARADAEPVTPKNLIGVVYAVFNSSASSGS